MKQIKIITSDVSRASSHAIEVNDFLKKDIEIIEIQNSLTHGYGGTGHISYKPQIVTIINYKELS